MDLNALKNQAEQLISKVEQGDETLLHSATTKEVIAAVIEALDKGQLRVATLNDAVWTTHSWIKKIILYYFRTAPMQEYANGPFTYFDKIPLKKNFKELNIRVVPPATARYGSFMEAGVILMPSYVNIGAYVGANTMVDTWATVGSCAQIGAGVHLSGGVGIGGVLEPASDAPVIVEDGAFVGSRCILVEGVRVGKEAVLAANVTLTSSTPIVDTRHGEFTVSKGYIPPRCVVLPGTREKELAGGKIHINCVYIVGERKESTDKKTSLTQALREFAVSV